MKKGEKRKVKRRRMLKEEMKVGVVERKKNYGDILKKIMKKNEK